MPPLTILWEHPRVLVVAKPPGLLSVPAPQGVAKGEPTLVDRVRREGHPEVLAVHRLDRETTGAIILARDPEAREAMMRLFKQRGVEKTYLAVVVGHPKPPVGVLRYPIKDLGAGAVIAADGQPAETRYRVIELVGPAALVELALVTGRHNQARLHFARFGYPLVGERKYAYGRDAPVRHKRAALHSARLVFVPPGEDASVTIEAPLPIDLRNLLVRLRALPGDGGGRKRVR